jgi:pentapeptide MXKDX repeat protein
LGRSGLQLVRRLLIARFLIGSVPGVGAFPRRIQPSKENKAMKRFINKTVLGAALAFGALAGTMPGAWAQASGAMSNDAMSHDAMSKSAMSHDSVGKDGMSHDKMGKGDKMKKHDAMGMDHAASGAMAK